MAGYDQRIKIQSKFQGEAKKFLVFLQKIGKKYQRPVRINNRYLGRGYFHVLIDGDTGGIDALWRVPVTAPITPGNTPVTTNSSTQQPTLTDWKTYRNEKYGFEFKSPSVFGNLTEDGAYFRFSGNKNFFLYTSSAPAKSNNQSQAKDRCSTLANSFLYCRYVASADNKWIFIQAQHTFQDVELESALNALTDPLPKSKDTNYATYLNFFLELPELASIRYADRIKMTKEDLSEETKRTIDELDQILSTFKFIR